MGQIDPRQEFRFSQSYLAAMIFVGMGSKSDLEKSAFYITQSNTPS